MLVLKPIKERINTLPHINVYHNEVYIGYIIKALVGEPEKWAFVNEIQNENLYDKSKGFNRPLFDKTKKLLTEKITNILLK
jgi:hypothetical protein